MKSETGIRRKGDGWQVYVRVQGEFRSKAFPEGASLLEMRRWREQQKARAVLDLRDDPNDSTLTRDVRDFLALCEGIASYDDRERRMKRWLTLLGARTARSEITSVDIRRGLEQLRQEGYAPATLNLFRMDLQRMFTVLDGKAGRNPVLDVTPYRLTEHRWRLPSWDDAGRAIGQVKNQRSADVLNVMRWTGLPNAQIKQLLPSDLHAKAGSIELPGRKKGAGTPRVVMPLLPQAVRALKRFFKNKSHGQFSNSNLRRDLLKGCKAAKVVAFHPYLIRHLFLTEAARTIRDDRVIMELAQHRDTRMTRRYTAQSVDPRVKDGLAKLFDRFN